MVMTDMAKSLMTLSTEGVVKEPLRLIDRLLAYAITTDALQSNLYRGNLTSIQAIIQDNQGDMEGLQRNLETKLRRYFGRFFDDVEASVTIESFKEENGGKLLLRFGVRVVSDGIGYEVERMANFEKGLFKSIMAINDYGSN